MQYLSSTFFGSGSGYSSEYSYADNSKFKPISTGLLGLIVGLIVNNIVGLIVGNLVAGVGFSLIYTGGRINITLIIILILNISDLGFGIGIYRGRINITFANILNRFFYNYFINYYIFLKNSLKLSAISKIIAI